MPGPTPSPRAPQRSSGTSSANESSGSRSRDGPMHAQLIPTELAEEASGALAALLQGRVAGSPDEEHFARDWVPLWDELARDGWTTIADRDDSQFSLLDLTSFAQIWGRYLVPLPFVTTLAVRRHLPAPPGPADRLTYAVAEPEATLVPYGPAAA